MDDREEASPAAPSVLKTEEMELESVEFCVASIRWLESCLGRFFVGLARVRLVASSGGGDSGTSYMSISSSSSSSSSAFKTFRRFDLLRPLSPDVEDCFAWTNLSVTFAALFDFCTSGLEEGVFFESDRRPDFLGLVPTAAESQLAMLVSSSSFEGSPGDRILPFIKST